MLTIKAYASGSSGNCYTVTDGTTTVMLDCGLPLRKIQQLACYKMPDIVLVTHEHKDHCQAAGEFLRRGVDVFMTHGTAKAVGLSGHRLHIAKMGVSYTVGNLRIWPFPTHHDAEEPCGFLIDDSGGERLLYATDTYYLEYTFPGLTKIMIEANHSYEILEENVKNGSLDKRLAERLVKSHFSIENVIEFFRANDMSNVSEIWLIHLSRNNADPSLFKEMAAKEAGKPVYVAGERGMEEGGGRWQEWW